MTTKILKKTPWGAPQYHTVVADGVVMYSTAGHGGVHLSRKRQAQMPFPLRLDRPWYEEDCDWARVALAFPDLWPDLMKDAHRIAKDYFPYDYETHFGVEVPLEESWVKTRDYDARMNKSKLVVKAAWARDEATVKVVVERANTGQRLEMVIPAADYRDHMKKDWSRSFVIPEPFPEGYELLEGKN